MEEEHLNHPTAPILCVKIHLFNWVGSCFYVRDVCRFSLITKPYSTTPCQCNLKRILLTSPPNSLTATTEPGSEETCPR